MVSIDKAPKNFYKCANCRRSRVACNAHSSRKKCQRCFERSLSCNPPTKSDGTIIEPTEGHEFSATISGTETVLILMQQQVSEIHDIVHSRPQYAEHDHSSIFCSPSPTLLQFFRCFASKLGGQRFALQKLSWEIQNCLRAALCNDYPSPLRDDLAFYPGRGSAEVSVRISKIISRCVEYFNQERETDLQAFDTPAEQAARLEDYEKVALNMESLICHTSFALEPRLEVLLRRKHAVPASHIAYWNKDPKVALQLWLRKPQCCDLLDRTFPQIVAENGDLDTLHEIARYHPTFLGHAQFDARGLSSLSVAICKSFKHCVDFMLAVNLNEITVSICHQPEFTADGCFAPKLLDFAFASRNDYLVRCVLYHDPSTMPYVCHAQVAIELGRGDIASLFLPSLGVAYLTSQDDVSMLEKYAMEKADEIRRFRDLSLGSDPVEAHNLELRLWYMQDFVDKLPHRVRQVHVSEAIASMRSLPQTYGPTNPSPLPHINWSP